MSKFKKNLAFILLVSLSFSMISSDLGGKFPNRASLAIATENKPVNYNLPGFPEDKGRSFDWSQIDWDQEITLYPDAVEFREKVLQLKDQGKMNEIKALPNPKTKMSSAKALEYYNVPPEVRNLVLTYVAGKINKDQLKNAIQQTNKINGTQINNQKVDDLSRIINIKSAPKLKVKKVNFLKNSTNSGKILWPIKKAPKSQNDKFNYYLLNDEVLKENVRKMMENRKTSYLDDLKNWLLPKAKAAGSSSLINYYEGIEKNPIDNALYYLSLIQNSDGSFGTDSRYEKTYKIVYVLLQFGKTDNDQFDSAINYLTNATPLGVREKALKIRILNMLGTDYQPLLTDVLAAQKSSYAYGFEPEYEADMLTTIEVMETLGIINNSNFVAALAYLLNKIPDNGAIYYEDGQTPSYHLTNELIRALKPVDGYILEINGQPIKIHDKIMAMINFLSSNYNTETEELSGTTDLIDYALTGKSFKMYSVEQAKLNLILAKLKKDQSADGSFAGDAVTTRVAMEALAEPDLIVKDIVNAGSAVTRTPATFKITLKNQGSAPTAKIDLFTFIDNYKFTEHLNIDQQGIVLNPGEEAVINYQFPNTESFKGDTNLKFYFEDANDFGYDDNWKAKTFNFAAAVDKLPALQVYYVANKSSIDNQPYISVRWPVKADPDRYLYVAGFRAKGTSNWEYLGIDNTWNGAFFEGFAPDKVYEVTAGVAKDPNTLYMFSEITEVKTSGDDTKYLGNVAGYVTDNNAKIPAFETAAYGGWAETDENGNFNHSNFGNGTTAIWAHETPYEENYTKTPVFIGQTVSNVRVFTRLKEDSTPPMVTDVKILSATNYKIKNQTTVKLQAQGDDNVSVKEGDFYIWNMASSAWEYFGTYQVSANQIEAEWYVPANYLGAGYKLKAVMRDFRGNQSASMEWGPFEIYDGTAPTGTVQVNDLTNNEWSLGETKNITWTVNSANQLKEISKVGLRIGPGTETIATHLDKDVRSINYTMPLNSSYATDSASVYVTVLDVNDNEGTFDSAGFKIVDKNTPPPPPWSEQQVVDLALSASGISRTVLKVIDNNDGSKEFIYQEFEGFCSQPEGVHHRLVYRKFANGAWENPVIIKDDLFTKCDPSHYFANLQAQKDDFGKVHIAYDDSWSGATPSYDQNEVYYAEVQNNQFLGVQRLSNDSTDSGGIKMTLSNNRVYIIWAEGYSWTTNSGERKVKYIEGSGLDDFTAPQIVTPTESYMGVYNLVVDNSNPVLVYAYYCQFFATKRVNNVWGTPLVIHRPDIKKIYLDGFTEDKDKLHLIVESDANNSSNYLWFDSVNTGLKLDSVLTANNFVHKQDIINAFCNNEYVGDSNSHYVNLFALGNSSYDLFYSQATPQTNNKRSVYALNFVNDLSKVDITPQKTVNFARVTGNEDVKGSYKISRRSDGLYHLLFIKEWIESNIPYSSLYHEIADYDYVYYLARVSATSFNNVEKVIDVSATNNNLFVYYPGSYNGESRVLYNYASMSLLPTAKAGNDQTVIAGTAVNLDGSLSSDNSGKSLTYKWLVDSSPAGSSPVFSNPNIAKPTFTPDKVGKFVLKLIVNNGAYDSLPDFIVIEALNRKPIANAGIDQNAALNQTVNLDGSLSSDPDLDPITYKWSFVTKPAGSTSLLSADNIPKPSFIPDKTGDYSLQLIVNDSQEASLPDQVLIKIKSLDTDGDTILDSVDNCVAVVNKMQVDTDKDGKGDACDNCKTISNADQKDTDKDKIGDVCDNCVSVSNPGQVDDDKDGIGNVCEGMPQENRAPTANAGADQNVATGQTVQLNGSLSSDPDNNSITYLWTIKTKPANSTATLTFTTLVNPTFIADKDGDYTIELVVNDGKLSSSPDAVLITAKAGGADTDGDTILDSVDNCVAVVNKMQVDTDKDGKGDACDNCKTISNADQKDTDKDKIGDVCDNCVNKSNPGQVDDDKDGIGNVCEGMPQENRAPTANAGADQNVATGQTVQLNGSLSSDPDSNPITYLWTIKTKPANSTATLTFTTLVNPTFIADKDGDYTIELVVNDGKLSSPPDTVLITAKTGGADTDGDTILDSVDNCVAVVNKMQVDTDKDGKGDACDNCKTISNADQKDTDKDKIGDVCDNCVNKSNPGQVDDDKDGIGNVCE